MAFKPAPLPHEWMLFSIIGFFVSWLFFFEDLGLLYPEVRKWGFAFMLFCIIVFIASIVSMSKASLEHEHLAELAIHEKKR